MRPATYWMSEFMRLVEAARPEFRWGGEKSLTAIIEFLGGKVQKKRDFPRVMVSKKFRDFEDLVWQMPDEKRTKYARALCYIFGEMGVSNSERLIQKKLESKIGWLAMNIPPLAQGQLPYRFIHCSKIEPPKIAASGGIDPKFSSEACRPSGGPLAGFRHNEFVFTFQQPVVDGVYGVIAPNRAAKNLGFAAGGLLYVYEPPVGILYYSQFGTISENKEIAFPQILPQQHLTPYEWVNEVVPPGQPQQMKAQQIDWNGAPVVVQPQAQPVLVQQQAQ